MTGSVVVFCMQGAGHLQVLLPLVAGLRACGAVVHVLTDAAFRDRVERAGGRFVDLFARYPIEAADATSTPVPCRFVSFAGVYGEAVAADVAALSPALVVYETFSVVGPVVARRLGIPYVNVCPNHAPVPARAVAALRTDPRVAISDQCRAAVRRLRGVHGMREAHPFWYFEALSPYLNLYAEPEEFLDPADRPAFEPLAFFGSLAPTLEAEPRGTAFRAGSRLRVYVAFGTVTWWYFGRLLVEALGAIARTAADLDVDVVVGLGGHRLEPAARAAIERPNLRVCEYADQWAALREADAFVTHHGLNSTHEAIFHRVPMLSYPLFSDQPRLARRCQDLGLAVPLVDAPGAPLTSDALRAALRRISRERERFAARLEEARAWELRTIAGRPAIVDHVLALGDRGAPPSSLR